MHSLSNTSSEIDPRVSRSSDLAHESINALQKPSLPHIAPKPHFFHVAPKPENMQSANKPPHLEAASKLPPQISNKPEPPKIIAPKPSATNSLLKQPISVITASGKTISANDAFPQNSKETTLLLKPEPIQRNPDLNEKTSSPIHDSNTMTGTQGHIQKSVRAPVPPPVPSKAAFFQQQTQRMHDTGATLGIRTDLVNSTDQREGRIPSGMRQDQNVKPDPRTTKLATNSTNEVGQESGARKLESTAGQQPPSVPKKNAIKFSGAQSNLFEKQTGEQKLILSTGKDPEPTKSIVRRFSKPTLPPPIIHPKPLLQTGSIPTISAPQNSASAGEFKADISDEHKTNIKSNGTQILARLSNKSLPPPPPTYPKPQLTSPVLREEVGPFDPPQKTFNWDNGGCPQESQNNSNFNKNEMRKFERSDNSQTIKYFPPNPKSIPGNQIQRPLSALEEQTPLYEDASSVDHLLHQPQENLQVTNLERSTQQVEAVDFGTSNLYEDVLSMSLPLDPQQENFVNLDTTSILEKPQPPLPLRPPPSTRPPSRPAAPPRIASTMEEENAFGNRSAHETVSGWNDPWNDPEINEYPAPRQEPAGTEAQGQETQIDPFKPSRRPPPRPAAPPRDLTAPEIDREEQRNEELEEGSQGLSSWGHNSNGFETDFLDAREVAMRTSRSDSMPVAMPNHISSVPKQPPQRPAAPPRLSKISPRNEEEFPIGSEASNRWEDATPISEVQPNYYEENQFISPEQPETDVLDTPQTIFGVLTFNKLLAQ